MGSDSGPGDESKRALARTYRDRLQQANELFASDPSGAARELQALADAGYARAMLSLGQRLCFGMGYPLDQPRGAAWIREAAEAGFAPAQWALAELLQAQQEPQSGEWLKRAADAGFAPAVGAYGEHLLAAGREAEGLAHLEAAAGLGLGRAMGLLGERACAQQDPDRGQSLLQQALDRGELHFGLVLGVSQYEAGRWAQAIETFEACRRLGAPGAIANLAYMARRNEWPPGLPRPDPIALLRPLADRGDAHARMNLALALAERTPGDPEADQWARQVVGDASVHAWWQRLRAAGDPEGERVLTWLARLARGASPSP